jgi:predicted anti-sigma-YlaC factor YlaD
MATVDLPAHRTARGWPSYALCAVALAQFLLAVPAFLLGHAPGAGEHAARELGACDVALAGCLLVAAWQPRRAAGLLPAALAVAAAMAVASITDVAIGHTGAMAEARHVLDVLGLAALWLVARSGAVPAAPRHGRPPVVAA